MITKLDYTEYRVFKTDYNYACIGLIIYIFLFLWMFIDGICFKKIFSGIVSVIWFMFIIYHIKEYFRIKKNMSIYSKEEIKEYELKHENILQSK